MARPRFQLIPGARLPGGEASGGVAWRLLGTNNRELGRAASSSVDADLAIQAIERVRTLAVDGVGHIVHEPQSGLWTWSLEDGERRVATSGRGFRHERECRYNLEQFRQAAPTAPASELAAPVEFPWQRTPAALPTEAGS